MTASGCTGSSKRMGCAITLLIRQACRWIGDWDVRRARKQARLTLPDVIRIGALHRLLETKLGTVPAKASIFARLSDGTLPIIGRKITFADADAALDNDVSRVTRIEDVGM